MDLIGSTKCKPKKYKGKHTKTYLNQIEYNLLRCFKGIILKATKTTSHLHWNKKTKNEKNLYIGNSVSQNIVIKILGKNHLQFLKCCLILFESQRQGQRPTDKNRGEREEDTHTQKKRERRNAPIVWFTEIIITGDLLLPSCLWAWSWARVRAGSW